MGETQNAPERKSSGTDADASHPHERAVAADLTKFQVRMLGILAQEDRYGLAIKRALEDYYGEEINHGRLYPNLDTLVEKDLVEKYEIDRRTNGYRLTERGHSVLAFETAWLATRQRQFKGDN